MPLPAETARPSGRDQLEHIASRDHHGVILRSQAHAVGMTRSQIDRRVRRGQWVSGPARGSLLLSGYTTNPLSRLHAVVLTLQAVAWGRSALALWNLVDHPVKPSVAIAGRAQSTKIDVTTIKGLDSLPRTIRKGISTINLDTALAAMSSSVSRHPLDHLIDEALRQRLTTWTRIESAFLDFSRQGRPGSEQLRRIIADRSIDSAIPLSDWSRDFANKLESSGLPRPLMEHRVLATDGSLIAQVDLAYPEHRYAIELDSVQHHLNHVAFETDRWRDANLARVGWQVGRFTWAQSRDDWDWVTTAIASQLCPAVESAI